MAGALAGLSAAALLTLAPGDASSQAPGDFADWTSVGGSPAAASGTIRGGSITLSGSGVLAATSVTDGSSTVFNRAEFTPPLPSSDAINFNAAGGNSYTISFGSPVANPVLHLGSLGSTLHFPPGTSISRLSGDAEFSVAGSDVVGQIEAPTDDGNGTVRLAGTYSSIAFTTTSAAATDGVYLQVGAAPPAPPPPPSGGGGGSAQPPPFIKALRRVNPGRSTSRALVAADVGGRPLALQWFVGGSSRPALTSAPGQNVLRLLPTRRGATVGVRPIGLGGSPGRLVRVQLPGSPAPSGSAARKVDAVVLQRPVLTAGSLSRQLLGRTPCIFIPGVDNGVRMSAENGLLDVRGDCRMRRVESLSDIPAAERGIVVDMARRYGIPLRADQVNLGLSLSDAYVSTSTVRVNGIDIRPQGSASVVVFPQVHAIASSAAELTVGNQAQTTGNLRLANPSRFVLDTLPRGGRIPIGRFPSIPGKELVRGFAAFGDVNIDAVAGGASLTAKLRLPPWLRFGGGDATADVAMRATTNEGLVLDSLRARASGVNIGALRVDGLQIDYNRSRNQWLGQGKACVIGGACLDMVPDRGHVSIVNGNLDFLGATLGFPPPGLPLFSGLHLEHIGFGIGLDPTRITAGARLAYAHNLVLDGKVILAFPGAGEAFVFDAALVGPNFPRHFYGRRHTRTTIGSSAGFSFRLPVVGEVPFARAYLLYEYPGYVALGGSVGASFLGVISIDGRVDGEFNADNGRFNVHGEMNACVADVLCAGKFAADVSNRGMSVCKEVQAFIHQFHMGGAIRWSPFEFTPYLDGCAWGRYVEPNVRPARAAQAGRAFTVQVRRGAASRMFKLDGAGGAPRVRVTGPGGQALVSPVRSGLATTRDARVRIMRSEKLKFAAVAFAKAAPGTYRIEPLPGSSAVSRTRESTALPPARIRARVRGRGSRRELRYSVQRRPGQQVTLYETSSGAGAREIRTVTGGGRGRVRFSPAPGSGRRTVVAQFEIDGKPAERIAVARFTPPSPRLGRPRQLRVRRRGGRLLVRWRKVRGAARYQLALSPTTGATRVITTRRTRVGVRVRRSSAGRLSVRAVDRLRQGRPSAARFRRLARPRTRLRALPRCRTTRGGRIVCRVRR